MEFVQQRFCKKENLSFSLRQRLLGEMQPGEFRPDLIEGQSTITQSLRFIPTGMTSHTLKLVYPEFIHREKGIRLFTSHAASLARPTFGGQARTAMEEDDDPRVIVVLILLGILVGIFAITILVMVIRLTFLFF